MKKISILIPTYNEEDNVQAIAGAVIDQMHQLTSYDYELIFIDNDSKDSTRSIIRNLCTDNSKIKAIFNAKNYGQFNSPYYGILQATGDCCIFMCADFQDPPELIPRFVEQWEHGHPVVIAQKTSSKEKKLLYKLRGRYYKFMNKHSSVGFIEQVTGFGLYDRSFIEIMRSLDDSKPFLRGIVAEFGYNIEIIQFEQPLRSGGISSNNYSTYYDGAMQSITEYTKYAIRLATFLGIGLTIFTVVLMIGLMIHKIITGATFELTNFLITMIIMLICSVQLFFLGLVGEYILQIRDQCRKRPLVIEKERINFEK